MKQRFYVCKHCGNIIAMVKANGPAVVCCGEPMSVMECNTNPDLAKKHKPVVNIDGNKVVVTIGEIEHPATEEHYIDWVSLETKKGNQRKEIPNGDKAQVVFMLEEGDAVINAYSLCNLHGLWKTTV